MNIDELKSELSLQEKKYRDLAWYSKRPPIDDESWEDEEDEIKSQAQKEMERIETELSDELASLDSDSLLGPDYAKGFNNGCLAAFRFVLMAIDDDPEEGGIEFAKSEFPDLHT